MKFARRRFLKCATASGLAVASTSVMAQDLVKSADEDAGLEVKKRAGPHGQGVPITTAGYKSFDRCAALATQGFSSTSLTWLRGITEHEYGVKQGEWVVSSKDSSAGVAGKISKQESMVPKGLSSRIAESPLRRLFEGQGSGIRRPPEIGLGGHLPPMDRPRD